MKKAEREGAAGAHTLILQHLGMARAGSKMAGIVQANEQLAGPTGVLAALEKKKKGMEEEENPDKVAGVGRALLKLVKRMRTEGEEGGGEEGELWCKEY